MTEASHATGARASARDRARAASLTPRVVVVGAGIGGLVSALLLASQGLRVQVLEAAATPGGKMRQLMPGGQPVDAGPTVLTMRWIFEHIFQQAGAELHDHVTLTPLHLLARHAWAGAGAGSGRGLGRGTASDSPRLDLHADRARSSDAIARFSGPREARRFERFCVEAQQVYQTLEGPYIRSQRPSVPGMIAELGPSGLARLAALGPLTSLWSLLSRRFEDPRLRQLFGRYATYCGASPWAAPATLMLVAQVEMAGVWAVQGGMHALALALARLAAQRGVEFHYGTPVADILTASGRASGVRSADGRCWAADAVVFNGDADALALGLLGPAARGALPLRRAGDRSLSALTAAVLARTDGFPLTRHNVFFHGGPGAHGAQDLYAAEFNDIFKAHRLPQAGTVYLCAQDRGDDGWVTATPDGQPERLLMLVNAPALSPAGHGSDGSPAAITPKDIELCETTSLALMRRCGLTLSHAPQHWVRTTPQQFSQLYPGSAGSLYGTATHGWMALFRRPGSTCRVPGLYLAGGSVHPGPGVPMAAMSGALAAEALMAHHASTNRWRPGATAGGTSTPSATTAGTG